MGSTVNAQERGREQTAPSRPPSRPSPAGEGGQSRGEKHRHLAIIRIYLTLMAVPVCMAIPAPARADIVGTVHQGSVQEDAIQWRSRVVFDAPAAQDAPIRAVLAAPLDPKLLTYPEAAVEPILTGDRVTALELRPSCGWEPGRGGVPASTAMPPHGTVCTTDIYVVQPLSGPRDAVHLQPPMLEGVAMQIVDVWGPEELMFIPNPEVGLEKRLTAFTPAGVDKDLPRRWDQRLGFARRGPAHKPLYFQSADHLEEGIAGELTSQGDRMRHGAIVAGIVFSAVVTALILAFLRLSRAARVERAEAELQVNLRRSAELLNGESGMGNAEWGMRPGEVSKRV